MPPWTRVRNGIQLTHHWHFWLFALLVTNAEHACGRGILLLGDNHATVATSSPDSQTNPSASSEFVSGPALRNAINGSNGATSCNVAWCKCADEGATCPCTGFARFGASVKFGESIFEEWSETVSVNDTIVCDVHQPWGDPARKFCACHSYCTNHTNTYWQTELMRKIPVPCFLI